MNQLLYNYKGGMMKTKVCRKCKRELPATPDYFYRNKKTYDKLDGQCRTCKNQYSKERLRKKF